jgi:hypothetical protein
MKASDAVHEKKVRTSFCAMLSKTSRSGSKKKQFQFLTQQSIHNSTTIFFIFANVRKRKMSHYQE